MTSVQHTTSGVHVCVESQSRYGCCPSCGAGTQRVHSYYERQLLDLPLGEFAVQLRVRVKRIRCQQDDCKRLTFAEGIPQLTVRYSRHTKRLADVIWHVGQVVGGRAGCRLAHKLQIPISRHSILRLLRRVHTTVTQSVRILGVDDWAKKRRQTYGTILVDLEDHRVIDLLPDREAETVARWLQQHPTVEIVTRDRSTEYANGITAGAPQACQVADRWHLLKNLTEMAQRALRDEWTQVRISKPTAAAQKLPLPRSSGDETQKQLNREQHQKRYSRVQYLKHKGYSQRRIARLLSLSRGMVRALYNATEFPERQPISRFSQLDPYLDYLNSQMETHKVPAKQLWQDLIEQGYTGSYSQVSKWITGFNKQRTRTTEAFPPGRLPGRDICLRLLTAQPESLTDDDIYLLGVLMSIPVLQQLYTLVQDFGGMIRQRNVEAFDAWLQSCEASHIQACQLFAQSLMQDYEAVRAALSTDWSNGQTEGQVHRLKLLKRQMYGRANLDLLRIRVCYKP
ncbi:MAG: ISL3 family transposase [Anaerolineae bacterium]|nr:ISL3 family transposase [Anaerolineae bacterium]